MKEKALAQQINEAINDFGFDFDLFAKEVMTWHPTLQQRLAKLMKCTFLAFAEKKHYDERNENAIFLAHRIKHMLELYNLNTK